MPIQETSLSIGRQQGDQPEAIDIAGNMSAGIKTGMQLASVQDTLDKQKMDVQNQKMDLQQKQSNAVFNRIKAAVFIDDPKIRNASLDSSGQWASQAQINFQTDNIKTLLANDQYRQLAKQGIQKINMGGVPTEAQQGAIMQFAGATDIGDMTSVLHEIQGNAQTQNQYTQQSKIESQKAASAANVAHINAQGKVDTATVNLGAKTDRIAQADSREYNKVVQPIETTIQSSDRVLNLVDKIEKGDLMSTKTLSAEIGSGIDRLLSGKAPTVSGKESVELHDTYSAFKDKWGYLFSEPVNRIAPAQLSQMKLDLQALKDETAHQHDIAFNSLVAGKTNDVSKAAMTNRFNKFRSMTGLLPSEAADSAPAAQSPAASGQSPSAAPAKGGFDMQKFQDALKRNGG